MPKAVALVACGIGALLVLLGLRQSRLGRETRGYARAGGRVVAAHVEEIPGPSEEGGPRFRPVVRYAFEARGRTWESEQLSIDAPAGAASPDAQEARRWIERYPDGSAVDVWFDPRDPRRSVLVRGVPTAQVVVAIAAGLALIGAGMLALAR